MKEINSFKKGVKDGIPICLGYLSVSFAFGIFSVGCGMSIIQTLLISMLNMTSAGQLAGVPIMIGGGAMIELAVTQLVINLRYSLMSVSLSQKLGKSIRLRDRFIISFGITDEIFAVSSGNTGSVGKRYMLGLIFTPYIGWSAGTLFGAIAGNILPEIVISALGVAIYGMFIAIVVPPSKRNRSTALCAITAVIIGCVLRFTPVLNKIPSGFVIIICAVVASALFAVISPISDDTVDTEVLKDE